MLEARAEDQGETVNLQRVHGEPGHCRIAHVNQRREIGLSKRIGITLVNHRGRVIAASQISGARSAQVARARSDSRSRYTAPDSSTNIRSTSFQD